MERVEFVYAPDYRSLIDTARQTYAHRYDPGQRARVNFWGYGYLTAAAVVLGLFIFLIFRSQIFPVALTASIIGAVGLFLVYVAYVAPYLTRISADMIVAARPRPDITFSADDKGLRWVDADTDFFLAWSGIEKVFVSEDSVGFLNGLLAFMVPRKSFADAQELRDFLSLALDHVTPDVAEKSRADVLMARALRVPKA